MAIRIFTIYAETDPEVGNSILIVGPGSGVTLPGDTLRFVPSFINVSGSVTLSGFNSPFFSTTGNIALTSASSVDRVLNSSGYSVPQNITILATKSGFTSDSDTFTIVDGSDATPDAFTLGTNVSNAALSTEYPASPFRVRGITANASISISGAGGTFRINGGSKITSGTAVLNDYIEVFCTSSSSFSSGRTVTLNIGGVTSSWTVTTHMGPAGGIKIPLGITSGTIKFSDIRSFFGGVLIPPANNLRAYMKGGTYVPNITENSSIPSSGTLNLRHFLGSYHSLYTERPAVNQNAGADTVVNPGSKTLSVTWNMNGSSSPHPKFGYGTISQGLEYRFTVTPSIGVSPTVISGSGSPGTFSTANTYVTLSVTRNGPVEAEFEGIVTIEARSPRFTSGVLTTTVGYNIYFKGP